jgi:uncharacterized phage infection (PIP) family protein YhgE
MASPDLLLNIKMLEETEKDLAAIVSEFEGADDFSDSVADATGQDHLADKVRDFATGWNEHRKDMLESIKTIHESVKKIYDSFDQTDKKLADAISNKGTS